MTELEFQEKVVCRYKNGRIEKGKGLGLDPKFSIYRLIPQASTGALEIPLSALKAVFCVKSFEGNKDRQKIRAFTEGEDGVPIRVCFRDDEILYGRKQTEEGALGFWMRLDDSEANGTMVFVPDAAPLWVEIIDADAGDAAYLLKHHQNPDPLSGSEQISLETPAEESDALHSSGNDSPTGPSASLATNLSVGSESEPSVDQIASDLPDVSSSDPNDALDSDRLPMVAFGAQAMAQDDFSSLPPLPGLDVSEPQEARLPSLPDLGQAPTNVPAPSEGNNLSMPPLASPPGPGGYPSNQPYPSPGSDSYGQPSSPNQPYGSPETYAQPPSQAPAGSFPNAGAAQNTGMYQSQPGGRDAFGRPDHQPPPPNSGYPPPAAPIPQGSYAPPGVNGAYPGQGQDPYRQNPPPAMTGAYPAQGQDPYRQNPPPAMTGAYPAQGQDPYRQNPPPAMTGAYPAQGQDPYRQNPPPAMTGAYPSQAYDPYSQPPPPATGAYPAQGQDPYPQPQPPPPAATGAYPAQGQDPYAQQPPLPSGQGAYPGQGQDPYAQPPPPAATGAYPAQGQDPYAQPPLPPLSGTGAHPVQDQDAYSQPPAPAGTGGFPVIPGALPAEEASVAPAPMDAPIQSPEALPVEQASDSVFASGEPVPSFNLGELTPGSPLGTGDLPSPDFSAAPHAEEPQVLETEPEEDDDDDEGHDQTFISDNTKDWGQMMGGLVAGAQVTVPQAISMPEPAIISPEAGTDSPVEAGVEANALEGLPMEPVVEPAATGADLPIDEPAVDTPNPQSMSIDAGTYDVASMSVQLPDMQFQAPGNDSIAPEIEPEALPMSALTAIEEPEERPQSLPTGEYSLEGNNVIAMPWLDTEQDEKATAKTEESHGADLDDLFEDPVEMNEVEPEASNNLDGALSDFLKDL